MTNLIAINGKIGSGKDTVAQIIQYLAGHHDDEGTFEDYNSWAQKNPVELRTSPKMWNGGWEIKKLAGALKQICSILTGIPVADFEKQEVKDSFLGEEWNTTWQHDSDGFLTKQMKVRELLQRVGTECLRDNLHENVHINSLFADYKPIYYGAVDPATDECHFHTFKAYPKWIISDLRFPNELKAIKDRGGITIRITRPKTAAGNHPSETALDNFEFDYEIDNSGTIEDLIQIVKNILIDSKII